MKERAGNSLDAVAQRWNRMRWKWLLSEQIIPITAPFTVVGCFTTINSNVVSTNSGGFAGVVLVDDMVAGQGIRPEAVVATAGAAINLNAIGASTTTAVAGVTLTFSRPTYALATNFKTIYDVRQLGTSRPLFYSPTRLRDTTVVDHTSGGTLVEYDLYMAGDRGKIRFLPPPSGAESVRVRYYRRMEMPSAVASATGLDVPEDCEDVFVAAAKAHFLVDKGQPNREQWAFWSEYAKNGIAEMRRDERLVEDENLTLQPHAPARIYNPNSPHYLGY